MGFTMRFPRALSIRDDLSISDCITASGAVCRSFGLSFFLLDPSAVLETVRSEKKRKMENVTEFGFLGYSFDSGVDHV
jgi:DNA ligase-4